MTAGCLLHETNVYAPGITSIENFKFDWAGGHEQCVARYQGTKTGMGGFIDGAQQFGADLNCGLHASATPSGIVSAEAAELLIEQLVQSLDKTANGVLLGMHGAMVSENQFDIEGEILRRVREKFGTQIPIAVVLDFHGNISEDMVERADLLLAYDTYPHVDIYERYVEAVQLIVRHIQGDIQPAMAISRPPLMISPSVMNTEEGPMKGVMASAFAIEKQVGVLNVAVYGGFPYSDVPFTGVSFVVTTDGDLELAQRYADELSQLIWELRARFLPQGVTPLNAVAQAMSEIEGPIILTENADNIGGGAPGDATHVLKHLTHCAKKALIVICDEEASSLAHGLGRGATFEFGVGGKSDKLHGEPIPIVGIVRDLSAGKYMHIGKYMTGLWADMGKTAVIESGYLTLVLTEKRTAPWDAGHIATLGLDANTYHVIVVKSALAWWTAFGDVCKKVIQVDSPGCCTENLLNLTYQHVRRPIYPLDKSLSHPE